MSLLTLLEKRFEEVFKPWNPRQVDPALLTSDEYVKLCDPSEKSHPSSAYDVDLASLNTEWSVKEFASYRLLRRFTKGGLDFELKVLSEDTRFAKRKPAAEENGDPWVRVNGQIQYYTREEIKRFGWKEHEYTVAIFHDGKRVASAQDEWGAMLIMVAREYRGFNLGTIIGKVAMTIYPDKDSGGYTPAGRQAMRAIHREFVKDAMRSGRYTTLVSSGEMTASRAKEIIQSVGRKASIDRMDFNWSTKDTKDWLLFTDHYGSFILYDRKLHEMLDKANKIDKDVSHFADRMILGYVYACPVNGITQIKQFGAENKKIAAFMLSLAHTQSKMYGEPLYVEAEEYDLHGFEYGNESVTVGYRSRQVTKGPTVDYRGMVEEEKRFRKSFDHYDEFKHILHEMALSKFSSS